MDNMQDDIQIPEICDEDAVRLAQTGNSVMEEFLIQKYKSVVRVRASSYFMVGADRDDVIQEGMIGLFKAIRDYNETRGASFGTFAEVCINRQMISAIKRAGRLKHSPLNTSVSLNKPLSDDENAETLADTIPDPGHTDPETLLLLREELEFIEKNGDDIFSDMEWKVWTFYMQGKSYTKIAELLNKTPKAIDNAIQRARKKLEMWLAE